MPSKLAISSMSLGRCYAGHTLEHKLDLASKYGYRGIELFHEDLADVAQRHFGSVDPRQQIQAAHLVRTMCHARRLEITCLQPFMHFEGLVDRAEHARRLKELALWIRLAHALGTDLIQIPSSFLPAAQVTADHAVLAADLRAAADLCAAATPPLRLAYEALAWGTRVDTWEASWALVCAADRPNLGLCLDTFNMAARVYADPTAPGGVRPGGAAAMRESLARLCAAVDPSRIFYVQVVDAERLAAPLVPGHAFHVDGQSPRMSWSRNCRLFYGEKDRGAYLPVREIVAAIVNGLGFEGYLSFELFHRRMSDTDASVPEELAKRGAVSWRKMVRDVGLKVETDATEASSTPDYLSASLSAEKPRGLIAM